MNWTEIGGSTVSISSKQESEAYTSKRNLLSKVSRGPRTWQWVEPSIWTDGMLTALVNGVKGDKWFSLIDKIYAMNTLEIAWKQVRSNKGCAGIDGVSIHKFEVKSRQYLEELHNELRKGVYSPGKIKRVYIPKGKGKVRPLGIPTVKDRIVQMAIKLVIEPIFENEFLSTSYGFRPRLGAKDALREVNQRGGC